MNVLLLAGPDGGDRHGVADSVRSQRAHDVTRGRDRDAVDPDDAVVGLQARPLRRGTVDHMLDTDAASLRRDGHRDAYPAVTPWTVGQAERREGEGNAEAHGPDTAYHGAACRNSAAEDHHPVEFSIGRAPGQWHTKARDARPRWSRAPCASSPWAPKRASRM